MNNTTKRTRELVYIALLFRFTSLIFEIIYFIVMLLALIPMLISEKARNSWVDSFMTSFGEYTELKVKQNKNKK